MSPPDGSSDETATFIRDLSSYQVRLRTFANWPFTGKSKCTSERMAASGLFHPSNAMEDVAQCFVCFKELEGWEPDDDPHSEHRRHSPKCPFLTAKPFEEMTAREGLEMDLVRFMNFLNWHKQQVANTVQEAARAKLLALRDQLSSHFSKRTRTKRVNRTNQSEAVSECSTYTTRSLRSTRSKR
ncbi:Baculoviral IAP repeat-containing protein 5 [Paragonimus heterotremus]|uniref:Baculoviral IAP repeat-containing protein 5 n=1 Tax=Paragonimus heterotremus TaxID=100268 RepID=A0A8J4SSI8_9TREM|nr:Baculoviral IAP repeat-containing protein 5 [Paragonimus heterotremus]